MYKVLPCRSRHSTRHPKAEAQRGIPLPQRCELNLTRHQLMVVLILIFWYLYAGSIVWKNFGWATGSKTEGQQWVRSQHVCLEWTLDKPFSKQSLTFLCLWWWYLSWDGEVERPLEWLKELPVFSLERNFFCCKKDKKEIVRRETSLKTKLKSTSRNYLGGVVFRILTCFKWGTTIALKLGLMQ